MRFNDAAILVMARAPVPGEAKTRLIPALGEEGAAKLHAVLTERLLIELSEADVAPITLCCTPDCFHPFFEQCREQYGTSLQRQQGDGLGERLYQALKSSLVSHRRAVVIGCDIPELGHKDVKQALNALEQGYDAAITPVEDGGYALLALKEARWELFEGVEWGGEYVFEQTVQRFAELGWRWHELTPRWDLDRPEDLGRLEHYLAQVDDDDGVDE